MSVELRTRSGDIVEVVDAPVPRPGVLTLGLRVFVKVDSKLYIETDFAEALPIVDRYEERLAV